MHVRKQRSAHLRLATQVRAQILPHAEGALDVSPKPREARADQERLRRPPGGVRHVAGGWGKSTPSHQPGGVGVVPGRQGQAAARSRQAASLDPIHSDSAPQAPARASGAFSVKGGSRGWCGPQPRRGRGHGPLTRPERPKPAGRVSGRSSPGTPAPRRRPRQGRRRRL